MLPGKQKELFHTMLDSTTAFWLYKHDNGHQLKMALRELGPQRISLTVASSHESYTRFLLPHPHIIRLS